MTTSGRSLDDRVAALERVVIEMTGVLKALRLISLLLGITVALFTLIRLVS